MKLKQLVLLGVISVLTSIFSVPDYAAATTDGSGEFVGVRGSDFYVNGQRFRHVGGNMNQLVYQPQWQVIRELDFARDAGLKQIRVWLPNDAYPVSDSINRLRWVADQAYARGLRLTVALTHNYYQYVWGWEQGARPDGNKPVHAVGEDGRPNPFSSDSRGFYTRYIGEDLYMLNDSWIDWGYTAYYKQYVRDVVSAMRDHPGIFAWDIANEVNASSADTWIVDRLVDFYRTMAAEIKGLDPNHLVTTGMISTSWAGMQDPQRDAVYNDPNIDYMTVHDYNGANKEKLNQEQQSDDLWRANKRYFKPIVVEEFGADDVGFAGEYYKERFAGAEDLQADAIVHWGVTVWTPADGPNWGSNSTPFAPVEQGKTEEYRQLWLYWAAQLQTSTSTSVSIPAMFLNTSTRLDNFPWESDDWDVGRGKAYCAPGQKLNGLSQLPGGPGRTALCVGTDSKFTGQNRLLLTLDAGDNRRASRTAEGSPDADWAPGYFKLECGDNEYVNGVSQNALQGDNRFHAITCAAMTTAGSGGSYVRVFDGGDSLGEALTADWDPNAFKGQCANNEYVVGVSVSPNTGAPHSLLCSRS